MTSLLADAARLGGLRDLLLHERRQHVAGADRIAGDAVLGSLERHRLGEAEDAVLGRDVGRLERRGDQPVRRGDVDDAAPLARLHAGHDGAGRMECRGQIDGDDRVPFGRRERLDRLDVLDAGIVDEHVDLAEGAVGVGDHARRCRPAFDMSAAE